MTTELMGFRVFWRIVLHLEFRYTEVCREIYLRNRNRAGHPIWHSFILSAFSPPLVPLTDPSVATVVKAGTRPLCETWNQVRKRGTAGGRCIEPPRVGGEREREREGEREEKIELCFRDSLFLARKKAQTRVACPPSRCPARRRERGREEEKGVQH